MLTTRNISMIVLTVVLFILLTPGVLVTIPPFRITGIAWTATDPLTLLPLLIHGTIFAVILVCLKKYVKKEQKVAKATGKSLLKTMATNLTKTVKSVASKVTGGIIASPSPAPTVSTAATTTSSPPVATPTKPVATPTTSPAATSTAATSTPASSPKK